MRCLAEEEMRSSTEEVPEDTRPAAAVQEEQTQPSAERTGEEMCTAAEGGEEEVRPIAADMGPSCSRRSTTNVQSKVRKSRHHIDEDALKHFHRRSDRSKERFIEKMTSYFGWKCKCRKAANARENTDIRTIMFVTRGSALKKSGNKCTRDRRKARDKQPARSRSRSPANSEASSLGSLETKKSGTRSHCGIKRKRKAGCKNKKRRRKSRGSCKCMCKPRRKKRSCSKRRRKKKCGKCSLI